MKIVYQTNEKLKFDLSEINPLLNLNISGEIGTIIIICNEIMKTPSVDSSGLRMKALEYIEKFYGKIVVNEVLSLKFPSSTDLFIHSNMRGLDFNELLARF